MSTSPVVGQLHVLSHMRGEKELLYILTQAVFFYYYYFYHHSKTECILG